MKRARALNRAVPGPGPLLCWMSRDQRVANNWALIHAQELALERRVPLAVVFTLAPGFLGAPLRAFDFMLKGLALVEKRLSALKIPFILLEGSPAETLLRFARKIKAGIVVSDFDPLRDKVRWRQAVATSLPVACFEVDAHNIVPAWLVSSKAEWAAYTLRPKIHRLLSEFLTEFPPLSAHPFPWPGAVKPVEWPNLLRRLKPDMSVPPVVWCEPGEALGARTLSRFLMSRLENYNTRRNDPTAEGQSDLSPYFHFGQVSAQRVAWEVRRREFENEAGQSYLEELIVRRELSDNFCLYNDQYDSFEGFPAWAQRTLKAHAADRRAYLYTFNQFDKAATHDPLWNAAQMEMVKRGKMHGYLRMYWAKKILEWSESPEEALSTAISLNDRYELDGRDPNGYAGIGWALGGVHDRPWFERPIFGLIRYMSLGGCRSKFDVDAYIKKINQL